MKRRKNLKTIANYPIEVQEEYLNKYYQGFEDYESVLVIQAIKGLVPAIMALAIGGTMIGFYQKAMRRAVNRN